MATASTTESDETTDNLAKPPFLRRVRIRGYKSIAFCDVTLEPLTILVGRNASGKSNFFDALAFVCDVMALGVTEAVKRRGGWSMIACRTLATQEIEMVLEAGFVRSGPNQTDNHIDHLDSDSPNLGSQRFTAEYRLNLSINSHSIPVIDREYLKITDGSGRPVGNFSMSDGMIEQAETAAPEWIAMLQQVRHLLMWHEHPLLGVISAEPISDLWNGVRHMAFYNFLPPAMRTVQRLARGQMLDHSGSNVASVLADIRRTEPWAFERIGRYLSAVVPQIESLEPVQYGEYETTRFRLNSPTPDKTQEFDAVSMSDGTLRVLAALTAIFQNTPPYGYPSVVGIEEPESALHPAAMRALVAAMDEATLRMQVLLTTHSPDLLDAEEIKPENVRVVQMIDGQTIIGPVDEWNLEVVGRRLNTLAGLERDDRLEPDLDDRDRQQQLQQAQEDSPV